MASTADRLANNLNFGALGKATELRQRLLFTLGALIVFRLGTFLPIPGINPLALQQFFEPGIEPFKYIKLFSLSVFITSIFCIVLILSPIWPAIFFPLKTLPGSKNTEVLIRKSIKNINRMSIEEKIEQIEKQKKLADKKKK